ncbi:hypothetical protein B0H13DRAFT_1908708 [Mycena leptocephala]|nr:hypothetical protein B0H13DRAFT_1908708 [Mycena leptocephala]
MVIKVLHPNSACDPEELRHYNKKFRLGPERFQTRITRPRCRLPLRASMDPEPLPILNTLGSSGSSSASSDSDGLTSASSNFARAVPTRAPIRFGSISPGEIPFTFSSIPMPAPPTSPELNLEENGVLVKTFDPNDGSVALESVIIPDSALVNTLFRVMLGTGLIIREPTDDEITCDVVFGTTSYHIREPLLCHIYNSFDRLAAAIHCAANDHNPYLDSALPRSIPKHALDELEASMPGISLFAGYIFHDPDELAFTSQEAAKQFIRDAQEVYVYFVHWMANCIRNSLEHGYRSAWNWGAVIGMSRTEFIHRCNLHRTYGGYFSLRHTMAHAVRGNEMDFSEYTSLATAAPQLIHHPECAALISRYAQRLLVSDRDDQIRLAIWPLPEPTSLTWLQEPADNFIRMYTLELGLTMEDLDTAVVGVMQTTVEWLTADLL